MTDRLLTNTYVSDVVDLESPDDLALADRMKPVGSGKSRGGESAWGGWGGGGGGEGGSTHPVHPRPDAVRHHRHRPRAGRRDDRPAPDGVRAPGRSSPTSCWPTRSTARRRRRSRRCSRRCRSTASRSRAHLQLAEPFYVLRDAEPDRAGRHLSAARSAARPLHVPHHHRPPAVRRGSDVVRTTTALQDPKLERPVTRRGSDRVPAAGAQGAGRGACDAARARHRSCQPAQVRDMARTT